MSYTKHVSHQTKKIQKQKFIMVLVKRYLSSDMRNKKKNHSTTSNTKLIQNYQGNIGKLYRQTKLDCPGKFWEPTNHTGEVLNNISYVSMKS